MNDDRVENTAARSLSFCQYLISSPRITISSAFDFTAPAISFIAAFEAAEYHKII
jgi:hypothetical protein